MVGVVWLGPCGWGGVVRVVSLGWCGWGGVVGAVWLYSTLHRPGAVRIEVGHVVLDPLLEGEEHVPHVLCHRAHFLRLRAGGAARTGWSGVVGS
jgi:hypothetical protein